MKRQLPKLWLALFGMLSLVSAHAELVPLINNSSVVKKIAVPTTASEHLLATGTTLQGFLNRLNSGTAAFEIQTYDPAVGPVANTIVLGTAADLNLAAQLDDPALPEAKEREHYLLGTANNGSNIVIAGTTDLAIRNGIYDFLERLGYAWYMPHPAWEITPIASATVRWETSLAPLSSPSVTVGNRILNLKIYADEVPDYKSRSLRPAFYNATGGNPAGEWRQQWDDLQIWRERIRGGGALKINHSYSYADIVTWAKAQSPSRWKKEYYSLVDTGRGNSNPAIEKKYQLCVANPAVQQLVRDYATAWLAEHPGEDSISLEPNDGTDYWCTCTDYDGAGPATTGCMALKWSGSNDDFLTDRVVKLANAVASDHPDKIVGILAYGRHAGPPSIPVKPNVNVQIANGYFSGGQTMDSLLAGWASRFEDGQSNIGIYDYFSLFGDDLGLPNRARASDLSLLKKNFSSWRNGSARADTYEAESSYSLGMLGLSQYLTMKLLWDVNADVKTLRQDFLTKCFGPDTASTSEIYDTMDDFFQLIDRANGNLPSADLIGRLYADIATAYNQTTDPRVTGRLDALALWLRYCELRLAFDAAPADQRKARAEAVLRHAWNMRSSSMVDSLAVWRSVETFGQDAVPARDEFSWPLNTESWTVPSGAGTKTYSPGDYELDWKIARDKASNNQPEAHPWKDGSLSTHGEIAAMVNQGKINNPRLPDAPRIYEHDLIPGGFPPATRGSLTGLRLGKIALYLRSNAAGALPVLAMSSGYLIKDKDSADIPYTLYENDAVTPRQTQDIHPDRATYSGSFFPERPNSHYLLAMKDPQAGTRISWDAGEKVSMLATTEYPFTQQTISTQRYFYVPKGTKNILAHASSIGSCGFFALSNTTGAPNYSQPSTTGGVDINIPITEAEAGQVWYVDTFRSEGFYFHNIPGVLAASPDELLLPKEAFAELQPYPGSPLVQRGSFHRTQGLNAFVLRSNAQGVLPTLNISAGFNGSAGALTPWKLYTEDGRTLVTEGSLPANQIAYPVPSGTRVPVAKSSAFLLVYDDKGTGSTITWGAGACVSIVASPRHPHSETGGVTRRYFYVPKNTQYVEYMGKSMAACEVHTLKGTKKYTQQAGSLPFTTQIAVGPGEDDQVWYFTAPFAAEEFYFTTLPGYLAARPDELLVPKWTSMQP